MDSEKPQWIHIEYAAGNYGTSAVFGNWFRRSNYEVLLHTVEKLVAEKGPRGLIFVNDLIDEWAQLAAITVQNYAKRKGFRGLQVRVLSGDISQIPLPYTHTSHLKNPRIGLIYLDAQHPFFKRASEHSVTGLEVTTHYPKIFLAQAKASNLPTTSEGQGERYRFPSGRRRRLPTQKFLIPNAAPFEQSLLNSESNLTLGRSSESYSAPLPTWMNFFHDLWHALLVTLGIRRQ